MYRTPTSRIYFNTRNDYEKFQVEAGCIDKDKMNTVYLVVKSFIKVNDGDYIDEINRFNRKLTKCLMKFNKSGIFRDRFITVQNISNNFEKTGFGFIQFDYTFFIKEKSTVNRLTTEIDNFTEKINQYVYEVDRDLKFIRKKLPNQKMIELLK